MFCEVIIEFATVKEIDRLFTYSIPEELLTRVKIGDRVKVSFGQSNNIYIAYVINITSQKPNFKLKPILEVIDETPLLDDSQIELANFLVNQYGSSYAASLNAILPPSLKDKAINQSKIEKVVIFDEIKNYKFKVLNEEQQYVYNQITQRKHYSYLIDGITGSGKTEIFLHVMRDVINRGETVIILVPEIALTSQTLSRFKERFGNRVALTHSRIGASERQRLYIKAKQGKVQIIIGPRSAVFMPLLNLGLIIVDEEHDASYKSFEASPKYSAKEVASYRMKTSGLVILASATPSFETYYQAKTNQIGYLRLTKRTGDAQPPNIDLVDMRKELEQGNTQVISRKLHDNIKEVLSKGQQVMLLLNRRGHSTFINCRKCGFVVKCKNCDVPLTYHLIKQTLECHHCLAAEPVPKICPSCGSKYIKFFGNGTQKVEEYLNSHFIEYGIGRMDLDTTTGKEGHSKILKSFRQKEINILVGTQMISKGHDFENVTLVGIISADSSLFLQDFRANERTFQLLTQTLGRAGRGKLNGNVIIQTYNPEHEVLQLIKNYQQQDFYKNELTLRQIMGYPPFGNIFGVLISGEVEEEVIQSAHLLKDYYMHYNKNSQFRIIGPVSAIISKISNKYRWKITIIGTERNKLLAYGKYCIEKCSINKKVTTQVKISWDIDPMNIN
ncbi:primosomal protein N' [Candidatus Epulonipiscium fishelsonii]|uniref:Primosomal protein N n=1 Tax=Candidatus Epulonipiscium fishelsonii TaxID=77094 RepID=A0ACC8XDP4_9FIRM|nr:primosomal protein N' [Epulopiscium sp. SCG-B05WGA-EpuloA1]ONI41061.1 primosomal protein N' [Epulopiscium sp. SCG-B11WGA-EpuloA1]